LETSKIADFLTSPAFASGDIQMNNPQVLMPNGANIQLSMRMDSIEENVSSMSSKLDQILAAMQRNQ
jgi:hypothetical protein